MQIRQPSGTSLTYWLETSKKYQTMNIGLSEKTDPSANAVIYANNQEIKSADTLN